MVQFIRQTTMQFPLDSQAVKHHEYNYNTIQLSLDSALLTESSICTSTMLLLFMTNEYIN